MVHALPQRGAGEPEERIGERGRRTVRNEACWEARSYTRVVHGTKIRETATEEQDLDEDCRFRKGETESKAGFGGCIRKEWAICYNKRQGKDRWVSSEPKSLIQGTSQVNQINQIWEEGAGSKERGSSG